MELIKHKINTWLKENYEIEQPIETMTFSYDEIQIIVDRTINETIQRILQKLKVIKNN